MVGRLASSVPVARAKTSRATTGRTPTSCHCDALVPGERGVLLCVALDQRLAKKNHAGRTSSTRAASFDYLVGAGEQGRRNREAERVGGFQVNGEVEPGGQRDGQVGGLTPSEDLVNVIGRQPIDFSEL